MFHQNQNSNDAVGLYIFREVIRLNMESVNNVFKDGVPFIALD